MSLGDTTKCDLSANIAKVDYNILLKSLNNYMAVQLNRLKEQCERFYPSTNPLDMSKNEIFKCVVHGSTMELLVEEIRKTAELIHTLERANPFDITAEKRTIIWVK